MLQRNSNINSICEFSRQRFFFGLYIFSIFNLPEKVIEFILCALVAVELHTIWYPMSKSRPTAGTECAGHLQHAQLPCLLAIRMPDTDLFPVTSKEVLWMEVKVLFWWWWWWWLIIIIIVIKSYYYTYVLMMLTFFGGRFYVKTHGQRSHSVFRQDGPGYFSGHLVWHGCCDTAPEKSQV